MAGASTQGKAQDSPTKDGTLPLSPGQSQGITGASPGGPSPAAAAAAAAGTGASIKIDPPKDAQRASDGNPVFSITAEPKMPTINVAASIVGITSGADPTASTEFTWTATLGYDSKNTPSGVSSGKCTFKGAPAKGKTCNIDALTAGGKVKGGAIVVNFNQIRGGTLTISATAEIGGKLLKGETKGWRIQGTNPEPADVNKVLPDDTFRKLTCLESQKKQFVPAPSEGNAMYPQFSGDGCLGVGICQLTNPQPTDDQIWDWTENVKAGVDLYNDKSDQAKSYPSRVAKSPNFIALAKAYIDDLNKAAAPKAGAPAAAPAGAVPAAAGTPAAGATSAAAAGTPAAAAAPAAATAASPPAGTAAAPAAGTPAAPAAAAAPPAKLEVKVPEFTADQLEDDTIRGFNGWAGDDGFTKGPKSGRPELHEFRIQRDPKTNKLVVVTDAKTGTLSAVWERVPVTDRPSAGDPNYIADVKSYDTTTCKKNKK